MDQRCLLIEELETIPELPDEDPRRRHVQDCPRCAARLASLRLFEDPPAPARRVRRVPRGVFAGLAAAAAVLLLWLAVPATRNPASPSAVLRGENLVVGGPGRAAWTEDGGLRLRWASLAEPAGAWLLFTGEDLAAVARYPLERADGADLESDQVPLPLRWGEPLLWSVVRDVDGIEETLVAPSLLRP